MTSPEPKLTRLNKFISDTGYCSRREADKLIDQQRITINGKIPEMGTKVADGDEVLVDGKPLKEKQDRIYIAFNKPVGITCTTERHVEGNIVDYINHEQRIFPIGRLDKPSDGLIFLTNDGDIVNKILRAGNAHEKEYVVRVDKPITDEFLQKMAAGVPILDTVTLPCKIKQESRFVFRITLTQGLNRQIRRMCEYLDYEVFKLKRVRIMNIDLGKLASGEWRYLSQAEMDHLNGMIGTSSKTEEASRKVKEIDGKVRVLKKASSGRNHHSNNTFKENRREKAKEGRFSKSAPKRKNDRKEQGKPQSEIKVWRPK
ncbi:23S rRNA pseudouridine(2604) synthase RluF [Aliivibrio fischeri]|uniref:23S rRNA pseudouridine(2604) synthase RluF n=1 Tax=Aliivibrio fischeri TaxID=668 RepID=UPI00080DC2F2|nr:23S rRNA pseudouridine(2604) synthase RluF [Aliivibrio fischeri]MUH98428.1 23S rRNA pseudouridine(2604) synthase RluF [Aliivibrio fischeri]MUI64699.1 23S rRNA pseudouridine(2604) synthase RluF [Aliivibrio fischeri]OCH03042.1 23S rRNA pseudouridine synthase F [Aliivibrio fischeri]OCH09747.1 23S rRNA pseudouridine synthase F [Aliivibrio fischeri]